MDSATLSGPCTLLHWENLHIEANFDADDESSDIESTTSEDAPADADSDSDSESDGDGMPDGNSEAGADSGYDTGSYFSSDMDSDHEYSSSSSEDDDNDDAEPSGSDHDSNASGGSTASSYYYSEERFATFQDRIRTLAHTKIWPGSNPADILVEKQKSHMYMRASVVTHLPTLEQCVVRVPWWDIHGVLVKEQLDHIRFVEQFTTNIPSVSVVISDLSSENPIERPYIVTRSAAGKNLSEIYKDLGHQTRCQIAQEVGEMYRNMLETQYSVPGNVIINDKNEVLVAPLTEQIVGTEDAMYDEPKPSYEAANDGLYPAFTTANQSKIPEQSVTEIMYIMFDKWRSHFWAKAGQYGVSVEADMERTDKAHFVAYDMRRHGCLEEGMPFTLGIGGFDWDTVMVDPSRSADGLNLITAIRDLDRLEFGPAFNQCIPPLRLWDPENENEEGKPWVLFKQTITGCQAPPTTDEGREIKAIFDEAAGPIYRRFAYDPLYVMARNVWKYAVENFPTSEYLSDCRPMIRMWKRMKMDGVV
ncbi:hypothetical protein QBC44DRAFT_373193 [Cladorrhinum sp. PSN332]|nr:hypothetical protein QBC44DRAFT_373193 [Cladorrhinum sp. PSN332]